MATYDNPRTGVVHWVPEENVRSQPDWLWIRTACHFLDRFLPSRLAQRRRSWNNFDPLGVPADVTCCKCRETAVWLDEAQQAAEAEDSPQKKTKETEEEC